MVNREHLSNRIIKVWSHRRSGTNYLCCLLYLNFYAWRNMSTTDDDTKIFVSDTGEISFYSKWGKLFGGHVDTPPVRSMKVSTDRYRPKRWMYIKRNEIDTARSWYNREDFMARSGLRKGIQFSDFLKSPMYFDKRGFVSRRGGSDESRIMTIIEYIKKHHKTWEDFGVYVVQYEDLVADYKGVLTDISEKFNLKFAHKEIKGVDRKVGWDAA